MTQVELNTELSSDLVFILLQFYLSLVHDLHSANKTSLFVLNKHHLAKLTFSHLLSHCEIRLLDFPWDCGGKRRVFVLALRLIFSKWLSEIGISLVDIEANVLTIMIGRRNLLFLIATLFKINSEHFE